MYGTTKDPKQLKKPFTGIMVFSESYPISNYITEPHIEVWMWNISHKFVCFNIWSSARGNIWEGYRIFSRPLLEEMHHWGQGLDFYSLTPLPVIANARWWASLMPQCHAFPTVMACIPSGTVREKKQTFLP